MPDVFVPEGHRLWEFNGVREEVIRSMRSSGLIAD
jgi:hypothetical protein